nr:envelope membrane protein [Poropsis sp. ID1_4]
MKHQISFFPISIKITFRRFFEQICNLKQNNLFVLYKFRISRRITIASFQCFFFLIFCPSIFNFFLRFFILDIFFELPITFLNFSQQEQTFTQIQTFSQQLYFEKFFQSSKIIGIKQNFDNTNITLLDFDKQSKLDFNKKKNNLENNFQNCFFKFAYLFNKQSLLTFRNWISNFITFLFFGIFVRILTPQISILKFFFIELLCNLNEISKCFFLVFFLDLFVGFHSSKGWEIFLYWILENFGFQIYQNQNFIALFISTFPVFLDTILKYFIFFYLNRISPSTVVTYQAMIE